MYFGGIACARGVTRRPREVCAVECYQKRYQKQNTAALQIALNAAENKPEGCLGHTECLLEPGITVCIFYKFSNRP